MDHLLWLWLGRADVWVDNWLWLRWYRDWNWNLGFFLQFLYHCWCLQEIDLLGLVQDLIQLNLESLLEILIIFCLRQHIVHRLSSCDVYLLCFIKFPDLDKAICILDL